MKDIVPIEKSSLLNDTSDIIEQAQQAVLSYSECHAYYEELAAWNAHP